MNRRARLLHAMAVLLPFLIVLLLLWPSTVQATYINPIGSGADPFVTYTNGYYYYLFTTGGDVQIRRSTNLPDVVRGTVATVFRPNSEIVSDIWAPELHYINGKWYVFATGNTVAGTLTQRLFVLEGNSQDPMGSYTYKGIVDRNMPSLDATKLVRAGDNALFMVWSQWDDQGQSLYVGPLLNPWTLGQPRMRISTPTYPWERNGNVNEGPFVLKRGTKTFIVYSASGTWTPDYCLGMLVNTDGNYTNAASWTKFSNPVFRRRDVNGVYCVGHNSFTKSPSGAQNWIVYHGTSDPTGDQTPKRNARIQRFIWNSDDTPNFDVPVPANVTFAGPDEAPGAPIRGLRGEYFTNATVSGAPAVIMTNATMDFDWGNYAPALGVPVDGFSVRWSGMVLAPVSGAYTFQTVGDDGIRLWVNGRLLVSDWNSHVATTNTGTIQLSAGDLVPIRMEYFDNNYTAMARLSWVPPGGSLTVVSYSNLFPSSNGLRADYFVGRTFNKPALTRIDPSVNFDWGTSFPEVGMPADAFSVRWTGRVMPRFSGDYNFYTASNDGVRLWVNNQLLVDNWTVHNTATNSGIIPLVAGQKYEVQMEYYENAGPAVARLEWSSASQAREVIPHSQLFLPAVNKPLTVALISPVDGSIYSVSDSIVLSASVSDSVGAVTNVQFFGNNVLLATITNSAYSLTLSNQPPGLYSYYALATDNTGLRATSAVTQITVSQPLQQPTLSFTTTNNSPTLSWPTAVDVFSLYTTTNLNSPIAWSLATNTSILSNGLRFVPFYPSLDSQRFFRLQSPTP